MTVCVDLQELLSVSSVSHSHSTQLLGGKVPILIVQTFSLDICIPARVLRRHTVYICSYNIDTLYHTPRSQQDNRYVKRLDATDAIDGSVFRVLPLLTILGRHSDLDKYVFFCISSLLDGQVR